MSDDDTPNLHRPGHWDDDRRVQVGIRHRVTSAPRGIPVATIDSERTPVWDERNSLTPMTLSDGQQIIDWTKSRTSGAGPVEVLALKERIAALERDVEPLRALRKWLWSSSIAAVLALGAFLLARGDSEGESRQRLRQVEQFVDELRRDVRDVERSLGHHSFASPAHSPDAISSATEGQRP